MPCRDTDFNKTQGMFHRKESGAIITPNFPIELSHDLIRWLHLESISIVQLLQLQELIVAKHIKSSPIAVHWSQKRRGYKLSFPIFSLVESSPKEPEG